MCCSPSMRSVMPLRNNPRRTPPRPAAKSHGTLRNRRAMRRTGGPTTATYVVMATYVAIERSVAIRLGGLGGATRGDARSRGRFRRLRTRDRTVLHREAALEGTIDLL